MPAGTGLERPAEVVESCLRGAADALLSLPGAPVTVGLKPAAATLLDAVDALAVPPAVPSAAPLAGAPAVGAGPDELVLAGRTAAADGAGADPSASVVQRVREAAEVPRGQLKRPSGYHRARAAGIAVQLMGAELGGAQEQVLDVWGKVCGKTSSTLHSAGADRARAAAL